MFLIVHHSEDHDDISLHPAPSPLGHEAFLGPAVSTSWPLSCFARVTVAESRACGQVTLILCDGPKAQEQ